MHCMQCFLESKYIKSRTFNHKNRWIIKKVMILKKLLLHLATRGTYSPGDWRCDEAWCEEALVYPPMMCQQRLSYCTWELNVMRKCYINASSMTPSLTGQRTAITQKTNEFRISNQNCLIDTAKSITKWCNVACAQMVVLHIYRLPHK